MKILYFFSKTDISIIKNCPSSARNIQATFGFFVLITGIMAFMSGTYAISNMFIHENEAGKPEMIKYGWIYSVLLGLVYSSFIIAIDREIVSANTKWAALLRIPIAIVISLVVSVPIELQIFEARINKQLVEKHDKENENLNARLENSNRIFQLESDIRRLDSLKQNAIEKRSYWTEVMEAEVVGRVKAGRTGKAGKGPDYLEAEKNKELQEDLIRQYSNEIALKKIDFDGAKQQKKIEFHDQRVEQSYDLLSKYIALKELKRNDQTGSASIMGFFITALFCLFELIPSIIKVLTPETEYDFLLEKRRRLNIHAAKTIYQKNYFDYDGKSIDEIGKINPLAVENIYASQSR